MEGIQNALMKRYAKQKLQELIGGGQASNKNDAQSMVMDMLKEQFGIGHGDAKKVCHESENELRNEGGFEGMMGKFFGGDDDDDDENRRKKQHESGSGGIMGQAAKFFGGDDDDEEKRRKKQHEYEGAYRRGDNEGEGYGRRQGYGEGDYSEGSRQGYGGRGEGGYGNPEGVDMEQAHRMAAQALSGGQFADEIVEMLMDKFGLDRHEARAVVMRQRERMEGAAGGGSGPTSSFADKAEGFLERMTGQ
jgi:hypothetical protein